MSVHLNLRKIKIMKIRKFTIIALAAQGLGLAGGDRIFIELSKRWQKFFPIEVLVSQDGYALCQRQNLTKDQVDYRVIDLGPTFKYGFLLNYLSRIIVGIYLGLSLRMNNDPSAFIYSASEFWMDSLTCFILKIRHRQIRWVAAWYQTAPNPLSGFSEGLRKNRYLTSALVYWLVQLPIKPLISQFADYVFINNQSELKQFKSLNHRKKAIVVHGAVDLRKIDDYIKNYPKSDKEYAAVFQGRFHPQKGVVELIDIWSRVVKKLPDAKLAMIGDGPLMEEVKRKIVEQGLQDRVDLLGFVFDGEKKFQIFSKSRLVVHPAFYDSGGMAAAEAMAFSLPAVGFDLEAYRDYYPQGMIKVKIGEIDKFAKAITGLLTNDKKQKILGQEARKMIESTWSWDHRAQEILLSLEQ